MEYELSRFLGGQPRELMWRRHVFKVWHLFHRIRRMEDRLNDKIRS